MEFKRGDKVRPLSGRHKDKIFIVDDIAPAWSGDVCLYLMCDDIVIFRTAKRVVRVDQ